MGKLVIVLTNSADMVIKHHPDWKINNNNLYAHSFMANHKGIQGFFIILNFDSSNNKITHGVIAHEAIHATNAIFSERGVVADFYNDEPYAYLIKWIVDQVHKFIQKHKKNIEL